MSFDCAVIFAGPSLSGASREFGPPIEMRPPARRGDIYRVALEEPRAILLIDGVFEDTPAVFHKEILWALTQGIHVFGAASLGALRAAELDAFGMIGHGTIYEDYRHGRLERDDAVAVLHGPAELGWPSLTTALVDMQATVREAERQGVIGPSDRLRLEALADGLYWRERTFDRLIDESTRLGFGSGCVTRLQSWLRDNAVSQKRADALGLIAMVEATWDRLDEPFTPSFRFEATHAWMELTAEVDWERQGISQAAYAILEHNLRSTGEFQALEAQALAMCLAERAFQAAGAPVQASHLDQAAREFRATRSLTTGQDVADWLKANALGHSDYLDLVKHTRYIQHLRASYRLSLATNIVRLLRSQGALPPLDHVLGVTRGSDR
ncbi:TfuA-like protein [Microvirga yunnanensis]|uniref:TfuA-like protein n=1 Tax=Microvirga yunnanensis TaxID=2953740 RepID=UPI0021C61ABC|nr:TfuA-like protein [Microvirga sp. HBU65207]